MPEVEFEPTITASEGARTVHALDLSAIVTGPDDALHTASQYKGHI
jgi:hypothetical protein